MEKSPQREVLNANPNIDIWGVNVYRWDQPGSLIEEWKSEAIYPSIFLKQRADSFMAAEKDRL